MNKMIEILRRGGPTPSVVKRGYTASELWDKSIELGMPLAEFNCTCLDEPNYYVGDSGFCWFCELVDKLTELDAANSSEVA